MVLFQGTNRILDKVEIEDSNSTATVRILNIYGVTSYNNLDNCIFNIKSANNGVDGATTLNINNLGAKPIKYYDNGVLKNPTNKWVSIGQTYQVVYYGNNFILVNKPVSEDTDIENYYIPDDIISLTSSSTTQEIKTAYGDSELFVAKLLNANVNLAIKGGGNSIYVDYNLTITSNVLTKITLYFNNSGVFTKHEYSITDDDLVSLTVTTSDLFLRNANNTQY